MNLPLQVHAGPLPDYNAQLHNDSAKQAEPAQTEAQAKVIIAQPTSRSRTKHSDWSWGTVSRVTSQRALTFALFSTIVL